MKNKTILITGINGFVGQHLVKELSAGGNTIVGVGTDQRPAEAIKSEIYSYYSCDLRSSEDVEMLPLEKIDSIVHLAGLAEVGFSFENPLKYISVNSALIINLAEAALKRNLRSRFVVVSSGAVYDPKQEMPLTENSRVGFNSPYAVSKVAVENLAQYYSGRGLEMIIARPFNHVGPGQKNGFLLPDLSAQVREAASNDFVLSAGTLSTRRDYTDVRDVATAYRLLATGETIGTGIYNICSGKSISGEEILSIIAEQLLGSNASKLKVVTDPKKVRPLDAGVIAGSNDKIHQATGWSPTITMEKTIADFLGNISAT